MTWPTQSQLVGNLDDSLADPVDARPDLLAAVQDLGDMKAALNAADGIAGLDAGKRMVAVNSGLPKRAVAKVVMSSVPGDTNILVPFSNVSDEDNTGFFNPASNSSRIFVSNLSPKIRAIQIDLYLAIVMLTYGGEGGDYIKVELLNNGQIEPTYPNYAVTRTISVGGWSLHYRSPYLNLRGQAGEVISPYLGTEYYEFRMYYGTSLLTTSSTFTVTGFCSVQAVQ